MAFLGLLQYTQFIADIMHIWHHGIVHNLLCTMYCTQLTEFPHIAHNLLCSFHRVQIIGIPPCSCNATIHYVLFIILIFIVAAGNPQLPTIATIYCGYCHLLGCAGDPTFLTIHCAQFIGVAPYCHRATIHYASFIVLPFIVATVNPRITVIRTIHCIYCGYSHVLGCTGNLLFHTIHCALFIGAPAYCHNATIHYAIFIMPGFIVATGNSQFTVIHTIYCVYYGYCHLLGGAGNPLFRAIYCVRFIGVPAYDHNTTIHCAMFIMPGFIGESQYPP